METKNPKTEFLLEDLIIDLSNHLSLTMKDDEVFLLDLFREKIEKILLNGTTTKIKVPSNLFKNLHNYKLSYSQLINKSEVNCLFCNGIYFIPTLDNIHCTLKVQKKKVGGYPSRKMNIYWLDIPDEIIL